MDLGFVQDEEYWPGAEDDSWMLGAVGKGTMCYECFDYSHYAGDCPYSDGKGGSTFFQTQTQSKGGGKAAKAKEKAPARTDA